MQSRIRNLISLILFICFAATIYFHYLKDNFNIATGTEATLSILPVTTTSTTLILEIKNKTYEDDEIIIKTSKKLLEMKRRKSDERKLKLKTKNHQSFYGIIAPEAECPNLIRIGRIGDGGKWICNPFELLNLENPCIFYSLGLNNEISFDLELMEITKNQCKHIAVDMNEQEPHIIQYLSFTNFLKGTISYKSNETFNEYTLQDLMIKYNTSKIDILKMDIEDSMIKSIRVKSSPLINNSFIGTEYSILEQLIKIEICQILIELHSPDKTYKLYYQWLNTMSKAGFYLIHFEINEGTMLACEFTLIHKSCFEKYGVLVIKKFLS